MKAQNKIMKTITRSNSSRLRRAVCTLLLGITALWAMPSRAHAQIYVSELSTNTVGEYDATTGAPINANLITGVIQPEGLLVSGNTLFVSSGISNGGYVGTYNATTGAPINPQFITSGVNDPGGLALLGNTLFVTNNGIWISTYDATTGFPINNPFIQGLTNPYGLLLSGNNLYVSQDFGATNSVGEYNASNGAPINAQLIVTNPNGAYQVALSGNNLFVAGYQQRTVGEYDATTGAVINANFITGLLFPLGVAVVGNTLYVTQDGGATPGSSFISTYDATTGAVINANFITGLNGPRYIAVASVPEPSTWSMIAAGSVALLGITLRKKHRIA
jgi:hypothetical protein